MAAARRPDKGQMLELRLARLLFAEGAFVRRSVDLRVEFGAEFTVTDIDVMALTFQKDLAVRTVIAECKSGLSKNAPKAADRLLWGRGLRDLLQADGHVVVTAKQVGADARTLAGRLGSDVLDERDISRREAVRGLDENSPYGSHDPELLMVQKDYYNAIRRDEDLKRAWQFVHSEGWLADPVIALKRALGACQLLSRKYGEDTTDQELAAIVWLFWQSVLVFTVAAVKIAGLSYRRPEDLFQEWFLKELSGGVVPARELDRMSRDVDEYVLNLLRTVGATPAQQVDALGFLAPRPPRYAESLVEMIRRLAAAPAIAAELPRVLDYRIAMVSLGVDPGDDNRRPVSRLIRLIASFLRGQGRVRAELLEPLSPRPAEARHIRTGDPVELPEPEQVGRADDVPVETFADTGAPTLFERHDHYAAPALLLDVESVSFEEPAEGESQAAGHLWITVRNTGDEPQTIVGGEAASPGRPAWPLVDGQGAVPPGGSRRVAFEVERITATDMRAPAEVSVTLVGNAGPLVEARALQASATSDDT
jgi:hypothetical protein